MARLQILLAENDDDTRDLYSFMLANAGVQVMAVRNGFEALAALQEDRPDLILTDVAMPVVSGVDLIKIVKSRVDYADLPVIAMTAHGEKIRRLALSAGANMAMHKPIRYDELRDAINSALDRPEA
jgi:CheY-like chemotaxis protein